MSKQSATPPAPTEQDAEPARPAMSAREFSAVATAYMRSLYPTAVRIRFTADVADEFGDPMRVVLPIIEPASEFNLTPVAADILAYMRKQPKGEPCKGRTLAAEVGLTEQSKEFIRAIKELQAANLIESRRGGSGGHYLV